MLKKKKNPYIHEIYLKSVKFHFCYTKFIIFFYLKKKTLKMQ